MKICVTNSSLVNNIHILKENLHQEKSNGLDKNISCKIHSFIWNFLKFPGKLLNLEGRSQIESGGANHQTESRDYLKTIHIHSGSFFGIVSHDAIPNLSRLQIWNFLESFIWNDGFSETKDSSEKLWLNPVSNYAFYVSSVCLLQFSGFSSCNWEIITNVC